MGEYVYTAPPWAPERDLEWVETCANVQSMQFMIDCLPMIRELIEGWPSDAPVRVLDVGTATGAGANLLATLYAGGILGRRMVVDAIDIAGGYLEQYVKAKFPLVNYMVGDVASLPVEEPWDLVICSHTIEHIEDYRGFVTTLQKIARRWVLFYAPWNERNLIPEHVNRIDEPFLKRVGAVTWRIVDSPAWRPPLNTAHPAQCQAEDPDLNVGRRLADRVRQWWRSSRKDDPSCVIFVVPGCGRDRAYDTGT
jgi:SAM-dependent methyltransferase